MIKSIIYYEFELKYHKSNFGSNFFYKKNKIKLDPSDSFVQAA
jgi:hypothetical protein